MSNKLNRKKRNDLFISLKNNIKCDRLFDSGNGLYHSYQELCDPNNNYKWANITFLGVKNPRKCFVVSFSTCEMEARLTYVSGIWKKVGEKYPLMIDFRKMSVKNNGTVLYEYSEDERLNDAARLNIFTEIFDAEKIPKVCRSKIEISSQASSPIVDVRVSLNVPNITDKVVREFINRFYEMGEPIEDCWQWVGEEEQIVTGTKR